MEKERNIGIDLLRIVLMYMICTLHTLSHGGVLGNAKSTINFFGMWALYELFNCAVNAYALISGYFSQDKPQNYKRIIKLWFTAFFYSVGIAIIINVIAYFTNTVEPLNSREFLECLLPVTFGNWYFRAYFALFFLTPFINKALSSINKDESRRLLIIILFVFSALSTVYDNWFSNGLHAFWLLILYIIGALMKKGEVFANTKTIILVIIFFASSILSWFLGLFLDIKPWRMYTSPTIILAAMVLLILFTRISIKNTTIKKIVKFIAPLTFGIYLVHDNFYVSKMLIDDSFVFVTNYNLIIGAIMVLSIALTIFIICLFIEMIRNKIFKLIKIDTISEKIIEKISLLLNRITSII